MATKQYLEFQVDKTLHDTAVAIAKRNNELMKEIDLLTNCVMDYINKGDPHSISELRKAIDRMVELQNSDIDGLLAELSGNTRQLNV